MFTGSRRRCAVFEAVCDGCATLTLSHGPLLLSVPICCVVLQFTEHFEGTVPPGEGVSAILKAKLGHHYRVRYTAHQSHSLIQEFTAHQHNAIVEVWPCSIGSRVFALGCIILRLALSCG